MATMGFILTLLLILNSMVWLAISSLILYNVYHYTVDKYNQKKDMPPFFRKYARFIP